MNVARAKNENKQSETVLQFAAALYIPRPDWQKLQRSGVQLSERIASLWHHGGPIKDPLEEQRTSRYYGIEWLKGG